MRRKPRLLAVLAATLAAAATTPRAEAQNGVPIEANPPGSPDRQGAILGPSPGAGDVTLGESPGASGLPLLARPGRSHGVVPSTISRPAGPFAPEAPSGIISPTALPRARAELPSSAALALPEVVGGDGPADGITLDRAIERLVAENLDLRTQAFELPHAAADVLTAWPAPTATPTST